MSLECKGKRMWETMQDKDMESDYDRAEARSTNIKDNKRSDYDVPP